MFLVETDEQISDTDREIIERIALALIDQDAPEIRELIYLLEERIEAECVCLELACICGGWNNGKA